MSPVTFTMTYRFEFEASHFYPSVAKTEPAGRPHGHRYEVEVEYSAPSLDEHNFVVDSSHVEGLARALDHQDLNTFLKDVVPGNTSAEALAWWIFQELQGALLDSGAHERASVTRVLVVENSHIRAELRAPR